MNLTSFNIDHLLNIRRPSLHIPAHLSASGNWLSITAQGGSLQGSGYGAELTQVNGNFMGPADVQGARILLVNTVTQEVIEPFSTEDMSWGGQWAPNEDTLAAYIRRNDEQCLAIWNSCSRTVCIFDQIPISPSLGFEVPRWTPDSRRVLVKTAEPHRQSTFQSKRFHNCSKKAAKVYSFDPSLDHNPLKRREFLEVSTLYSLELVEVCTGESINLFSSQNIQGWRVAPDGNSIAVLVQTDFDERDCQIFYDLVIVPIGSGSLRVIAKRIPKMLGISFEWSPDSNHIAYSTNEVGPCRLFVAPSNASAPPLELSGRKKDQPNAMYLLNEDSEIVRWSSDGERLYSLLVGGDIGVFASNGEWSKKISVNVEQNTSHWRWVQRPASNQFWSTNTNTALMIGKDATKKGCIIAAINLDTQECAIKLHIPQQAHVIEISAEKDVCYFVFEEASQAPTIGTFSVDSGVSCELTPLTSGLDSIAWGKPQLIDRQSSIGGNLRSALMLPPDYQDSDTLLPLIVNVYGGEFSSARYYDFAFRGKLYDNAHLLVSQGYALLCPDLPINSKLDAQELTKLTLEAVDQVVDMGIADPERLAIMGHSFGGYCVLHIISQTTRFKAAVCDAGVVNLTSYYGTLASNGVSWRIGWCETGQGRLGGSPWEALDVYIKNSPLFYLNHVKTPSLIIAGEDDRGAVAQAYETFSALRRLSQRAELRIYPGEGHVPSEWSEPHKRDLVNRVLSWLDIHLNPLGST